MKAAPSMPSIWPRRSACLAVFQKALRKSERRLEEVVNEVYELFLDLDADESQIEFPIVYTNARAGHAGARGGRARGRSPAVVRRRCSRASRLRSYEGRPSAAGARDQPRRLAVPRAARPVPGAPRHDARASRWPGAAPTVGRAREGDGALRDRGARARRPRRPAGRLIAVAGLPEVTIGETLADPDDPRPLPGSTSTSRASR